MNFDLHKLQELMALVQCLQGTKPPCEGHERPVLVTTAHRGVFFGYASDVSGDTIKLKRARNAIYWPASNKGFLGLASEGPHSAARIGPAADIELRNITCVAECSETAVKAWESAPWSK
jgi:hypothetical protein